MDKRFARAAALLALLAPLVVLGSCRRDADDHLDKAEEELEKAGENIQDASKETGKAIEKAVEDPDDKR